MGKGPTLIFDKSTLQSLNPDESVWLDNFFTCNITPIFFVETLADLEKQVKAGRTPEQVVGSLAYKTPDLNPRLNAHHESLLTVELSGVDKITMNGTAISTGARPVALDGNRGLIFPKSPEEEAFTRWVNHEFLDLERQLAKAWRRSLLATSHDESYRFFQKWFPGGKKPTQLSDVKALTDANIDTKDQELSLRFGMTLLGVVPSAQPAVLDRWRRASKPPIREFTPYFRHAFAVDLFYQLAMAADLISRVRPSDKADNHIDLAYLYYLPFCKIFVSNDRLHERIAPLFMRENQTYVKGTDLKSDLHRLDEHYSALPDEVKQRGLYHFASDPPEDSSFLVTQLWDKHLPGWTERKAKHEELSDDLKRALNDLISRIGRDSRPINPEKPFGIADADFVTVERQVPFRKGKWGRFPPEARNKRS
jgi:hypothetical protein